MAKDKDPILEQKFFDLLFPIAFYQESQHPEIMAFTKNKLVDEFNILSKGTLLEVAISIKKNLKREDTEGRDFSDGSDAKTSSVRWYGHNKYYGAPIMGVHNKRGLLRCVIYERMLDKFYFFLIPYAAYCHISKTSNIDIPFNLDGLPKRNARVKYTNWWNYEVSDFDSILLDTSSAI